MKTVRKLFAVLLIVFLLSTLFALPVFAQGTEPAPDPALLVEPVMETGATLAGPSPQTEPTNPLDIMAILQWLVGGGGSILAVSWLLERMKWFQALSSDAKDYWVFGLSAVVACTALAIIKYAPPAFIALIAPFFLAVASTFVAVFLAKTFHRTDVRRK